MSLSFTREVQKELPFLFNNEEIPELPILLKSYSKLIPVHFSTIAQNLIQKDSLKPNENRFLEWIRFSIAYQSQTFSPRTINKTWSKQTHEILDKAWLSFFSNDDPVAIASMGKLGSEELNLSSDIDLIFFSEDSSFLEKIRSFINYCSASQEIPQGYKIDLDLRPEGKAAPLLVHPDRLGQHLWNKSDPWERYSYTRLKIEIGNPLIAGKVQEIRDKFCYRKYLTSDFFPKFLELRPKYHKSVKNIDNHLKLSPGGIRDLELLTQTFMILHGGRNLDLRNLSIPQALEKLANLAPSQSSDYFSNLLSAYLVLRHEEGLLHSFNEIGKFEFDSSKKIVRKAMNLVLESIETYQNHWNQSFKANTKSSKDLSSELEEYASKESHDVDFAKENFNNFFSEKNFAPYISAINNQEKLKNIFFDLVCTSPFGCQVLSKRPALLDLFILRIDDYKFTDTNDLAEHLSDLKMVQLILNSLYFSKNQDLSQLNDNVSKSYFHTIKKIFEYLNYQERIDLLLLGKAAGKELGLKSDLDFIIINKKDAHPKEIRDFFKLLSSPTVFGPLVPFDTRGGPQGQATPISVTEDSLINFIENKAEPWQRLMYLKNYFFQDQRKINFKNRSLSSADQESLNEVLHKRLKVRDPQSVFFKTEPGGIFHTEYLFANLLLKAEHYPSSSMLESWLKDLCEIFPKIEIDLQKIYSHFLSLRIFEQNYTIQGYHLRRKNEISTEKIQNILKENSKLIDSIYQNILS